MGRYRRTAKRAVSSGLHEMNPQTRIAMRPRRTDVLRTGLLAALLLPTLGACAPGQPADGDAADSVPVEGASPATPSGGAAVGAVADYELTMERLRRWAEANRSLERAAAADPRVEAALEPAQAEEHDVDASVAIMAETIEGVPEARKAIEDAGLSPREYVVIGWTMLQSGMAGLALKAGGDTAEVAREMGIKPSNLRFLAEHEEEIAELRRQRGEP